MTTTAPLRATRTVPPADPPRRPDRAMEALAAGRVLLGGLALAAPARLVRMFGMSPNPQLEYLTRIFGGRAVALGAGYLTEPAEHRARWHRLCLFVDAADTLTAAGHLARRDVPRPVAAALGTLTGSYLVVGLSRLAARRGG